jgi:hypothetical protein
LKRIHSFLERSLKNQSLPVLSIQLLTPQKSADAKGFSWISPASHAIVLVRVSKLLHPDGFEIEYIDPSDGILRSGYVHLERYRDLQITLRDGSESGKMPFLNIVAPSLQLLDKESPSHVRAVNAIAEILCTECEKESATSAGQEYLNPPIDLSSSENSLPLGPCVRKHSKR